MLYIADNYFIIKRVIIKLYILLPNEVYGRVAVSPPKE